jgi:hypothetical protein
VSKSKIELVVLFTKLVNVPIKHGFALDRWCKSITVMIEKDPGMICGRR